MLPRKYFFDNFVDDFFDEVRPVDIKCDIYEKDGMYHIEADAPGFGKDDIKVEYDNGYMTISAEKEDSKEDEDKHYIKKERSYGRFERQIYIGNIEEGKINAKFKDGILHITVPKEESKKKLIDIK